MSQDKFTLYWYVSRLSLLISYIQLNKSIILTYTRINDSRAHRILWILEILNLDYEVLLHFRDPQTWRCNTLFDVHPLGKAPILLIDFADGQPQLELLESGLIIQYLLKNYDPNNILNVIDPRQQLKVDYYLHYSEGTLQHLQISLLINSAARKIAPLGLKSVAKLVARGLNNGYYLHEWRLNMNYLESQLKKEGHGYFVGDKLSGADIILSFPVYENVFDNAGGVKEITGEKRNLFELYPNLAAWSDRISSHPLYIKVNELTESLRYEHELKKSSKN